MITSITKGNAQTFLSKAHGDVLRATKEVENQYKRGVLTMEEMNDIIELISGYMIFGWM